MEVRHVAGRNQQLQVVGQTSDGKLVVNNVFAMYNSRGVPLDIVFEFLRTKNAVPCWHSLLRDARKCGWKDDKILRTIEQSLLDSGHPDVDEIVKRLRSLQQQI